METEDTQLLQRLKDFISGQKLSGDFSLQILAAVIINGGPSSTWVKPAEESGAGGAEKFIKSLDCCTGMSCDYTLNAYPLPFSFFMMQFTCAQFLAFDAMLSNHCHYICRAKGCYTGKLL